MFVLDSRTLLFVLALISVGSAVVFAYLWRMQSQRKGVGFWVSGMSGIAVSSFMICCRGIVPDLFSFVLANLLLALSFLLILRGIRVFIGRPPLTALDFGLFPLLALFYCYFIYVDRHLNISVTLLSAMFAMISGVAVYTFLHEKSAPWRSLGYCAVAGFTLFGIANAIRGVLAVQFPPEYPLQSLTVASSYVYLGGVILIGTIAITLILLTYAVLESELRIFSLAVEQSASSIIITDLNGDIEYVNPAAIEKTGYLKEELIGRNPRILKSGEMDTASYAHLWRTISEGDTWQGEFHNRKKNGELFWEISSISPVKRRNGSIGHFVAVKEDITALKEAENRIQHLAHHDGLTGLPARKLSMERLSNAVTIARYTGTKVAVLFADLDGFKEVNDSFGHAAGDRLLKEIADRLRSTVRDTDTVARIGGDEFLILINNVVDREMVANITQRMIQVVAAPYHFESADLQVSISIGIALYPEHGQEPQELVQLADKAMYEIKRQGKNGYAFIQGVCA